MIIMVGYWLTVYFDESNIVYILSPSPVEMQFLSVFLPNLVLSFYFLIIKMCNVLKFETQPLVN